MQDSAAMKRAWLFAGLGVLFLASGAAFVVVALLETPHASVSLPTAPGQRPLTTSAEAAASQIWFDGARVTVLGPKPPLGRRPLLLEHTLDCPLTGGDQTAGGRDCYTAFVTVLSRAIHSRATEQPPPEELADEPSTPDGDAWAGYDHFADRAHVYADARVPWPEVLAMHALAEDVIAPTAAIVVAPTSAERALLMPGWDGIHYTNWGDLREDGCTGPDGQELAPERCPSPVFELTIVVDDSGATAHGVVLNAKSRAPVRIALAGSCEPSRAEPATVLRPMLSEVGDGASVVVTLASDAPLQRWAGLRAALGIGTPSGAPIGFRPVPAEILERFIASSAAVPCEPDVAVARARAVAGLAGAERASPTARTP